VCVLYRRLQLYLACLFEGIECTVISGSAIQPLGPSLSPMLRVMSREWLKEPKKASGPTVRPSEDIR